MHPVQTAREVSSEILAILGYVLAVLLIIFVFVELFGIRGEVSLLVAVVVPIIAVLIILILRGDVGGFSFWKLQVRLNNAKEKPIDPEPLEEDVMDLPVSTPEFFAPHYEGDLEHRTILWFNLGEWKDLASLDEFVERMPNLKYVIFTDFDYRLKGLMTATDFRSVYLTNPEDFINRVSSESILHMDGVVTELIPRGTTNAEALEKMATTDVEMLGVIRDEDSAEFYGVITQDAISWNILLDLFQPSK